MTVSQNKIDPPKPNNNHLRKRWLIIFFSLVLLVALIYMIYWLSLGRYRETTDDAYVGGNAVQVMSQISGQVMQIMADITDKVEKGQVIAILDKTDTQIVLDHAKTNLAISIRTVKQYYDKVKQLQANVLVKEDNLRKVNEDYIRRKGLMVDKTISKEEYQHADIAVNTANDELKLAKEELASALSEVGNTSLYHHPLVEQAIINLRNAYVNWRRTIIYAPVTGFVARRPVQVGQQITPNTVLFIVVPLFQVWVDANFKESQVEHICIDQEVEMVSDLYGNAVKYHGKVIGLSPGTGSAFDLLPPQNATGNWIKIVQRVPVRISLDQKQLQAHPLQIGLSITATVNTRYQKCNKLNVAAPSKVVYQTYNYRDDTEELNKIILKILNDNSQDLPPPQLNE
ncbi:MAG: efflux RND transporter periplasmic adaptor subunit [Proteobacteria bacterium]|nr:efflux RND transporter periplasmic adaptor subunit [Pseudomonadota bacterium]